MLDFDPQDRLDYFTYRPSPTQPDDYLNLASEPASREEIRIGDPGGGEWFGQWLHLFGRNVGFDPSNATSKQRAAVSYEDIIHIPSAWFRPEYPIVEPLMAQLDPESQKIEYIRT